MSETPTPETDKYADWWAAVFRTTQLCRELKQERDEARRERDEALQRLSVWHGAVSQMKKQLSFAPPFHQGTPSQEEA